MGRGRYARGGSARSSARDEREGGRKKTDEEIKQEIKARLLVLHAIQVQNLFSAAIRITIQIVFAIMYKKNVVDRKNVLGPPLAQPDGSTALSGPGYKHGLCACCEDIDICLHVFFCMPTRAADTYHSAGVLDFWVTMLLALFCSPCFILCIMPCKRSEIRHRLGGSNQCGLEEFCLAWWCACCVVCQEARSVDDALGAKTRCCCNLQAVEETRMPLVGEVVATHGGQVMTPMPGSAQAPVALQPPPLPWTPPVPNAAAQAFQAPAVAAYAPVVGTVVQPLQDQVLRVAAREVKVQSQDTELQPMTDEDEGNQKHPEGDDQF